MHGFKAYYRKEHGRYGDGVHSGAAGETYRRGYPQTGRGGDAPDHVFLKYDNSRPDETDSGHDLSGDPGMVILSREGILGNNHEQSAAESDYEMGADPGFLGPELPLETYRPAQETCNQQPQYKIPLYCHIIVCLE